jgi:hypothetical protein
MTAEEITSYLLTSFEDVHQTENFGYLFFFVGEDRRLPFVTIASQDNEYEKVSDLSRPGVFRVNVGVKKETFQDLFPTVDEATDYTVLDRFLPHPDYAAQFWICILSPGPESVDRLKSYIEEAYGLAKIRDSKLTPKHLTGQDGV